MDHKSFVKRAKEARPSVQATINQAIGRAGRRYGRSSHGGYLKIADGRGQENVEWLILL